MIVRSPLMIVRSPLMISILPTPEHVPTPSAVYSADPSYPLLFRWSLSARATGRWSR